MKSRNMSYIAKICRMDREDHFVGAFGKHWLGYIITIKIPDAYTVFVCFTSVTFLAGWLKYFGHCILESKANHILYLHVFQEQVLN